MKIKHFKPIYEHKNDNKLPYKSIHIDGSTHYFKYEEQLYCWNNLLFDFKPILSYKYKTLYRTRTCWIVKVNGISSVSKFNNLYLALKELFYFTDILKLKKR